MSINKLDSRYGRFKVSLDFINQEPDKIRELMGHCIILRAEHMVMYDRFEYEAYSPQFETVPIEEKVPMYRWVYREGAWLAEKMESGYENAMEEHS